MTNSQTTEAANDPSIPGYFTHIYPYTFWVIILALAPFIIHFMKVSRDKRKAADDKKARDEQSRANFRSVICGFKAQVAGVDNWGFQDWYSGMQIEVEKQCALVESSVGLDFRTRFADTRKECAKQQTQRDLMDDRAPVTRLPVGFDRLPEVTYQRGRNRASTVLESLLDVCK